MRSSGGTNFGLARSVVVLTKSRIACFAGPSFHDPNARSCAACVWAIAVNGMPDRAGSNAILEINTRRLMFDDGRSDFIFNLHDLRGPCAAPWERFMARF